MNTYLKMPTHPQGEMAAAALSMVCNHCGWMNLALEHDTVHQKGKVLNHRTRQAWHIILLT
jgi:hypothetical protein